MLPRRPSRAMVAGVFEQETTRSKINKRVTTRFHRYKHRPIGKCAEAHTMRERKYQINAGMRLQTNALYSLSDSDHRFIQNASPF